MVTVCRQMVPSEYVMSHDAVVGVVGSGGLDTVLGSHVAWVAVPSGPDSALSEPFPTMVFAMALATCWLVGPELTGDGGGLGDVEAGLGDGCDGVADGAAAG